MGFQAALGTLSFFAVILIIPPLCWHIKSGNIPATCLIIWTLIMCLKTFCDNIVWGSSSTFETAWDGHIYCDIMNRIQASFQMGILCAVLGIIRRLYLIMSMSKSGLTMKKWQKVLIELAIAFLMPIYIIIAVSAFQSVRYFILKYGGCQFSYTATLKGVFMYSIWQVIISLVCSYYAILTLRLYFKQKKDFKDILHCTNSGLNASRFLRLLVFCFIIIMVMFPLALFGFIRDIFSVVASHKYHINTNTAHKHWKKIFKLNSSQPYFDRWIYISIAYITFILFGLGNDAREMYQIWLRKFGLGKFIDKYQKNKQKRMKKNRSIMLKGIPNYFSKKNMIETSKSRSKTNNYDNNPFSDSNNLENGKFKKTRFPKGSEKAFLKPCGSLESILSSSSSSTQMDDDSRKSYNSSSTMDETTLVAKDESPTSPESPQFYLHTQVQLQQFIMNNDNDGISQPISNLNISCEDPYHNFRFPPMNKYQEQYTDNHSISSESNQKQTQHEISQLVYTHPHVQSSRHTPFNTSPDTESHAPSPLRIRTNVSDLGLSHSKL